MSIIKSDPKGLYEGDATNEIDDNNETDDIDEIDQIDEKTK